MRRAFAIGLVLCALLAVGSGGEPGCRAGANRGVLGAGGPLSRSRGAVYPLKMNAYTDSVRNLLEAVEERRGEMQSPLRKFWRDLLGRLQTARGQAEEAARLVRQVQGTVRGEREQ